MNFRIAAFAAACIGAASLAVAQPTTSPSRDTSQPSTSTPSAQTEAPTTSDTSPSAASSPHQRQAMAKDNDKMMKDCIAKQRSENSSLSKSDAKKTCKEQMKSSAPANR